MKNSIPFLEINIKYALQINVDGLEYLDIFNKIYYKIGIVNSSAYGSKVGEPSKWGI